jgi:hypothetical protein
MDEDEKTMGAWRRQVMSKYSPGRR